MITFAKIDARGFSHLIFAPDSENRVQHYVKRNGVWGGIEKVNQSRSPGVILDCSDMGEELDRVFAKAV